MHVRRNEEKEKGKGGGWVGGWVRLGVQTETV